MTSSVRRLGLLSVALLLVGLALPLGLQAVRSSAHASEPAVEAQVLSLTNAARANAGLPALRTSATLTSVARSWSAHMAATRSLQHDGALGSKVSGWSMIGENIAMAWSASQAQQLWMSSSGHRANILQRRFDHVGVGVAKASDGSLWFTVDFEQTSGYVAPAPTPTPRHSAAPRPSHATARSAVAHRASRSATRPAARRTAAPARTVAPTAAALLRSARLLSRDRLVDVVLVDAAPAGRPVPRESVPAPVLVLASTAGVAAALLVLLGTPPATTVRARVRRLRGRRS